MDRILEIMAKVLIKQIFGYNYISIDDLIATLEEHKESHSEHSKYIKGLIVELQRLNK
jgi:hypothetical protein